MTVRVRDVLQMECLRDARLVAGERGLDAEVRWITVGEEPDLPSWVFGGEMILSTLFAVEPDQRSDYIKRLSDRGVAGMLIKPERFLGEIPDSVLEAADRESFPIGEVPMNVLWSRVLDGFYRSLLAEQAERGGVETEMRLRRGFFDDLISDRMFGEEITRRAKLLRCDLSDGGALLVFNVAKFIEIARKRRLDELQMYHLKTLLYETVDDATREIHRNFICSPRPEGAAVLLGSPIQDRWALARHVLLRCGERLRNLPVHAGLGEPFDRPDQAAKSYQEAESALCVGRRLRTAKGLDDKIHAFATLGIQRLLFALSQESPETLQGFKETTVGPVILYDEKHGTQLLKTLKAYMECNGNISEVAELLHVHKQSVRYRLRRITELTGLDVAKFQDAAQLYLALRATELL